MTKRRTKKQLRELENNIKLILILLAGGSFYFTRSLPITLFIVAIASLFMVVLAVNKRKKEKERLRNSRIEEIDYGWHSV
jgi:restriction system protein